MLGWCIGGGRLIVSYFKIPEVNFKITRVRGTRYRLCRKTIPEDKMSPAACIARPGQLSIRRHLDQNLASLELQVV